MTIELEGFAVKPDKLAVAHEWLAFLREHTAAVNKTLVPEHLSREQIFSVTIGSRLYLCWYSDAFAPAEQAVTASQDPIDQQHVRYWHECIDESVPSLKFNLENSFVNPNID